jgi:tetratricopeptide (TPR) repeat protein
LDRLALAQLFAGQPAAAAGTAQRAVALNPQHPNGYWSLGIAGYAAGELAQAVRGYRAALEREPRRPYLWHELGWLYLDLELPDQAESAFARTVEQLPREGWPAVRAALAWVARSERGHVPPALQRVPEDIHAVDLMMIRALAGLPLDAAALKRALDAAAARGESLLVEPWFLFLGHSRHIDLAVVQTALGERDAAAQHLAAAREHLDRLERQGNRWHAIALQRARLLALSGQPGPALDALAAAVAAGSRRGWWLDRDPSFASVRAEPRFVAIRAQISAHLRRQRQQLDF